MTNARESQHDSILIDKNLARAFSTNGRYNAYFLGVTGIGFFAIYILTRLGIFGEPAPQLVYIGGLTALLAAIQYPLLALARQNRGIAANLLSSLAVGIFTILLTNFWQGVVPVSILIVLITPITALRAGFPLRRVSLLLLIVLISIFGIFYVENTTSLIRLQNNAPAAVASFAFLIATALLLVTITVISENKNFKSLQTLLTISFIVIVAIPTLLATTLSTIGTFTTSQAQTLSTLKAITSLKESQISTLIRDFENDMDKLQKDQGFVVNARSVLTDTETVASLLENSKRVVRARVKSTIGTEEEHYTEVLILDKQGLVKISTLPVNEGMNFGDQLFFRQGILTFYTGFADIPAFENDNLIIAAPIYDIDGRTLLGAVALRSNAFSIKDVMENTPGFENAETYLVDKNYKAVTKIHTESSRVSTQASLDSILKNVGNTQGIYNNYDGKKVLGNYKWFNTMQVALIAEVPLSFVINSSLQSLAGSAILALFVISIAIAAVAISARSIVSPITSLAKTSESFAAGKLSMRAPVDRVDEIGALARSYNQMANQLQEVIGGLENRVNERTRDLESQSLRLRLAAEIGMESAAVHDVKELLERSAQQIQNRLGFDHVGIFLLDNDKEYAVLVAASSEAGKQMLANSHRLRVGEVGLVGRVAASGEPRISLNTDAEATYFNNPYLPDTRSEMVLPLKAERNVFGVLDIQSNKTQAFNADDISIMQIMADQLAASIERTRLLQELERSLKEVESAYGQYTRENWKRIADGLQSGGKGYRFDNIGIEPITEISELEKSAFETGKTINSNGHSVDHQALVAIPIKLRGQSIGVIHIKLKENYGDETISTIELASERLAAALESARLYEEARMRADREQSISQVTSAISASISYEEILQTTVREIGNTLRDAEVTIQIIGDNLENR